MKFLFVLILAFFIFSFHSDTRPSAPAFPVIREVVAIRICHDLIAFIATYSDGHIERVAATFDNITMLMEEAGRLPHDAFHDLNITPHNFCTTTM